VRAELEKAMKLSITESEKAAKRLRKAAEHMGKAAAEARKAIASLQKRRRMW